MSKYWSDLTHSLTPYVPGEQPQDQQYIKLNTNENPYPPSPKAVKAMHQFPAEKLTLYPDPESVKLKSAIADYYQIEQNQIFCGNGSDEVLALAFMAFFKNKAIAFPAVTYSFYPVYCDLFEIKALTFELNNQFEIDLNDVPVDAIGLIFPNPNAPTGILQSLNIIEKYLQNNQDKVVIVDEAYIDFGGKSCIALVNQYPNLLVIQTFSKSRCLAGIRVGFAIGHEALIDGLNRVKNSFNSYPIDSLAIEGAVAAMNDKKYFDQCCEKIINSRSWLENELHQLGFENLPSKANFIFSKHPAHNAEQLYIELKANKILVRFFNKPGLSDYLRITIGRQAEMITFVNTLKTILNKSNTLSSN